MATNYGHVLDRKSLGAADAKHIIRRCEELKEDRKNWDLLWEEIAHFVLPTKGGFHQKKNKGDRLTDGIFDSTAPTALENLASGLHGALTAPSGRWFHVRYRDEELNNDDEAVEWLEDCTDRIYKAFEESNFNSEVNELYLDLCCFGTAAMLVERSHKRSDEADVDNQMNFRTVHLSEISISEDFDGFVDTVYRKLKLTARQAVQLWGDKWDLGDSIKNAMEQNKPDKVFEFIHAVYPRPDIPVVVDVSVPKNKRPWASVWVNVKDQKVVQDGGYFEFPWMVPRWSKLSGDVYGFSPALMARADIRTLNAAKQFEMRAWEKSIDPPTLSTYNGIIGDLRLDPGGLTYVRDVNGIRAFNNEAQWQVSQIKSAELVENIMKAFHNDKLRLHEGPNMTATEVRARMELMQQILGPVVGRLQSELLNPLIGRVFMLMHRSNKFLEAPMSVQQGGSNLDIEYVSPLARAQRLEEVFAIERWFGQLGGMAQVNPSVMDVVDFNKIGRLIAKRVGVPAEAMRSEEEVAREQQERQQQQQQMQQAMQQQQGLEQAGQAAQVASAIDETGPEQVGAVVQGLQAA